MGTNVKIHADHTFIFWSLAAAFFAVFLIYGYLAQTTVGNIVVQKQALEKAAELYASIGELEARYAAARAVITPVHAALLGFDEAEERVYTEKTRLARTAAAGGTAEFFR